MNAKERQILKIYRELDDAARESLLAFAEFLLSRPATTPSELPEPEPIERPAEETVIAAIRRLSSSYHMVDAGALFNETSSLMTQHIMQGRPAGEVIDELERLFEQRYRKLVEEQDSLETR